MTEQPKPWLEESRQKAAKELFLLMDRKSLLLNQVERVDQEILAVTSYIQDTYHTHPTEPPITTDYGKTDSPLDIQIPTFNPKGIFRNFGFRGH